MTSKLPWSRRQALTATVGVLSGCKAKPSSSSDGGERTRSLADFPLRSEFRHEAGLVTCVPLGPIQANCYIVVDTLSSAAVVIDPGAEAEAIAAYVREKEWRVTMILATHGHVDHIAAVAPLQRSLKVPFAMHGADGDWLQRLPESARKYGYPSSDPPAIDQDLATMDTIPLGGTHLRIVPTPGHSRGGCCFHGPDWRVVFTGDTLFRSDVGRTDLLGGSRATLMQSIRTQLLTLDEDIVAYCGHDERTTIGEERRTLAR